MGAEYEKQKDKRPRHCCRVEEVKRWNGRQDEERNFIKGCETKKRETC